MQDEPEAPIENAAVDGAEVVEPVAEAIVEPVELEAPRRGRPPKVAAVDDGLTSYTVTKGNIVTDMNGNNMVGDEGIKLPAEIGDVLKDRGLLK